MRGHTVRTEANPDSLIVAPDVAAVALLDAPTSASIGQFGVSWWLAEVAAGRAPQPVIRGNRCTRWRRAEVLAYWRQKAEVSA